VLPVLFAGALLATRRSTRFSVLEAIRAGTSSLPASRLARAVGRSVMPLTIGLGVRDILARGRRGLLLATAVAVTGAVVVTALSLDAMRDARPASKPSDFPDELLLLIYTLDTVLLLASAPTPPLAFIASLVAVPLGIGLYLGLFRIAGDATEAAVIAPWWSLALIPVGTVLVVVAATSVPAWLATRIHTADALRYE
jgi:hypothetical protein